jgi:hypothetical protein
MLVSALLIRRVRRYQREVIRIHISKTKHWPNEKGQKDILPGPFLIHDLSPGL